MTEMNIALFAVTKCEIQGAGCSKSLSGPCATYLNLSVSSILQFDLH